MRKGEFVPEGRRSPLQVIRHAVQEVRQKAAVEALGHKVADVQALLTTLGKVYANEVPNFVSPEGQATEREYLYTIADYFMQILKVASPAIFNIEGNPPRIRLDSFRRAGLCGGEENLELVLLRSGELGFQSRWDDDSRGYSSNKLNPSNFHMLPDLESHIFSLPRLAQVVTSQLEGVVRSCTEEQPEYMASLRSLAEVTRQHTEELGAIKRP
ncbi:hypothetical protein C4577_01225 [Candidatus Parcubacteria bacterium]|nr:MAG: hypothetical protein C4577_01225 [Candidatus Parcubacteria bacterium]